MENGEKTGFYRHMISICALLLFLAGGAAAYLFWKYYDCNDNGLSWSEERELNRSIQEKTEEFQKKNYAAHVEFQNAMYNAGNEKFQQARDNTKEASEEFFYFSATCPIVANIDKYRKQKEFSSAVTKTLELTITNLCREAHAEYHAALENFLKQLQDNNNQYHNAVSSAMNEISVPDKSKIPLNNILHLQKRELDKKIREAQRTAREEITEAIQKIIITKTMESIGKVVGDKITDTDKENLKGIILQLDKWYKPGKWSKRFKEKELRSELGKAPELYAEIKRICEELPEPMKKVLDEAVEEYQVSAKTGTDETAQEMLKFFNDSADKLAEELRKELKNPSATELDSL